MTAASAVPPTARATLADLMRVDGKAELIGGRIVHFMASGHLPSVIAFRIARRLADYADAAGRGVAFTGSLAYAVPELPSGRESFSPDASYYTGPLPVNRMRFVEGTPDFAAEVRSENDSGPAAEREMADKRADYFAAGTKVVWDVDPAAGTVAKYTAADPLTPAVFGPGQEADAEPAVRGWRLPVDALFA
ncbi:MAG: Uma2 family endonuclease [Gemmataceae bacterium]|nr:Uma2 family endonuclease [Gemmataceae bacterium]